MNGELSCFETEWEYPELIHLVHEGEDTSDYLDKSVCGSMHPPSQFRMRSLDLFTVLRTEDIVNMGLKSLDALCTRNRLEQNP